MVHTSQKASWTYGMCRWRRSVRAGAAPVHGRSGTCEMLQLRPGGTQATDRCTPNLLSGPPLGSSRICQDRGRNGPRDLPYFRSSGTGWSQGRARCQRKRHKLQRKLWGSSGEALGKLQRNPTGNPDEARHAQTSLTISSVAIRVTPQPASQAEWRPSPPATMTTISPAARTMGTRVSGLVWSTQLGQLRLP